MVKKAVVYTPSSNAANIKNAYLEQKGSTPPYEDKGVRYQGYYKKVLNQNTNEYQLKPQTKAMYYNYWSGAASTETMRSNSTRFVCTGLFYCIDVAAFAAGTLQYIVKDGHYSGVPPSRDRFFLNFNLVRDVFTSNYLDLSGNPLIFDNPTLLIGFSTNYVLGANDKVTFILYGYDEND